MTDSETTTTVTILGSGTGVPSLKRSSCSVHIQTGEYSILCDMGPNTMRGLLVSGVEIFDLTHVLISHFHPDHASELVPFMFGLRYFGRQKPSVKKHLIGGCGIPGFLKNLKNVWGEWIDLPEERLAVREMGADMDSVSYPGLEIETSPANHNDESIAFRITPFGGPSIVYSGDTDVCDEIVKSANEADILILESALPDEMKVKGHLTPSLAGEIAAKAGVKNLVLTHFYPFCEAVDIVAQCRKTYSGPLFLAEDQMRFRFRGKTLEFHPGINSAKGRD